MTALERLMNGEDEGLQIEIESFGIRSEERNTTGDFYKIDLSFDGNESFCIRAFLFDPKREIELIDVMETSFGNPIDMRDESYELEMDINEFNKNCIQIVSDIITG